MRLIDADALINRIVFHTDLSNDEKEAFEDEINAEPTIEPKGKTGKWNCSDDMCEYAVCAVCNWDSGEPYEYIKKNFKYCPNCGSYNAVEAHERLPESFLAVHPFAAYCDIDE